MSSGVAGHPPLVAAFPAWRHASWRRRIVYAGICLGGAVAFVLAVAAAAFANAANPTSASAKVYPCSDPSGSGASCPTTVDQTKAVLVKVSGGWSWGELAGTQSSPQTNCKGRYGVGWSVDWWGMGNTTTSIPGLLGSVVSPATSTHPPSPEAMGSGTAAPHWGALSVGGTWSSKSGPVFHTSADYNGFVADLCNTTLDSKGAPTGQFAAYAVYPSIDAVPAQLCVNFYDPHGTSTKWSTSTNDNYANKDGDNSIKTNSFNPATVGGNCAVTKPSGSPQIGYEKVGPATGDPDGTGTYTVTLKNTGSATKSGPTAFVDMLPKGESFVQVDTTNSDTGMSCSVNGGNAHQVDCSYAGDLASNTSKNVAIVVRYGADTAGKALTDCVGSMPTDATVCWTTHITKPDLSILKTGPLTGTAGGQGTYTITVTNNGTADAPSGTFLDVLPAGESFVSATGDGTCAAGASPRDITCTFTNPIAKNGGTATFQVTVSYGANTAGTSLTDCAELSPTDKSCVTTTIPKPGALDLAIVKSASAASVKPNQDLTYTLTVTNVSDQDTVGPVTVTDAVPAGLTITAVSGGSDWNCGFVGPTVTCTYTGAHLAAGQAAGPITVTTRVLASAPSVLVNTGIVGTPGDTNLANNRSTVRTPVTKVLGTKIVKPKATKTPSVLPFTGSNTTTALTIGLALLVGGLRLINFAARRRRT